MNTLCRGAAAAVLLTLVTAGSSEATVVRVGATIPAIVAASRGNAVAYDPINHVYLVVSANGAVYGRFVDRSGNVVGAPFFMQANPALFGMFPRATFSPDANGGTGGFLVDWVESDAAGPTLHARMVSLGTGGAYGADNVIAVDNTWWEEEAYGAYSTANHEFLLVYRTTAFLLRGVRVDGNAVPMGPPFTISQTGQYENNPSIAYNPTTNQYLVCWQMFTAANTGLLYCRFVAPVTAALGNPILIQATGSVWFTDTTYNPTTNQFLVTWDETHGSATLGRVVNADGSLPGGVTAVSRSYAGYDGMATAYNPISRSFFMVSYDLVGDPTQDGGVEITPAGQPVDSGQQITAICVTGAKCANYYPQIAGSTDDPNWLVTTATSFVQTSIQVVGGQSAGGAPPPGPGPIPTPVPVAKPMVAVDIPSNNAAVSNRGFVVAGWAADAGAAAGTGVDVVAIWAFPATGGSAILAGVATSFVARPDVGAYLGAQFTNTGYGLTTIPLPPGGYTLAVYAHSTVNNSWNTPSRVNVTVVAPPSHPMMWVDLPAQNQTLSQVITVAGWAVDTAAASGVGVDAVHVWAYPSDGSAPKWVGAAGMGGARPDIAAWLGPQFGGAGFSVSGTLPPGTYTLVVFAHSAVTGTFNNVQVITIRVV
jgi:hypothetical protein